MLNGKRNKGRRLEVVKVRNCESGAKKEHRMVKIKRMFFLYRRLPRQDGMTDQF
jgi:hypothetical protein